MYCIQPSVHRLKPNDMRNTVKAALVSAKDAEIGGTWELSCKKFNVSDPKLLRTPSDEYKQIRMAASGMSGTSSKSAPPPLYRFSSTHYPKACCYFRDGEVFCGPKNLSGFIENDTSRRFVEANSWEVHGLEVTVGPYSIRFGIAHQNLLLCIEHRDPAASFETVQKMANHIGHALRSYIKLEQNLKALNSRTEQASTLSSENSSDRGDESKQILCLVNVTIAGVQALADDPKVESDSMRHITLQFLSYCEK